MSAVDLLALGLALFQRAIAGHVQRVGVGLFEDRHGLSHGFGLVDTRGETHQRGPGGLVGQAIAILATDLNQKGKDLLARRFLGFLGFRHDKGRRLLSAALTFSLRFGKGPRPCP